LNKKAGKPAFLLSLDQQSPALTGIAGQKRLKDRAGA